MYVEPEEQSLKSITGLIVCQATVSARREPYEEWKKCWSPRLLEARTVKYCTVPVN